MKPRFLRESRFQQRDSDRSAKGTLRLVQLPSKSRFWRYLGMNWGTLFGTSGASIFDVWFVVHFAFWLVVGAQLQVLGCSRMWSLIGMIGVATAWEVFERFAFRLWPDVWKRPESWQNAIVGDILLAGTIGLLVGYWLAERQ
jgi:hypothetical protein